MPMKMTRQDLRRIPLVFAFSMLGAYASAFVFVAIQQWSLPPTDLAYGQGLSGALGDPFVRDVAVWFATVSGLVVFIPAFFAVRGRNPLVCFAVALACVLLEIAVVTPFGGPIGLLAAFPVLAIALVWCHGSHARILRVR